MGEGGIYTKLGSVSLTTALFLLLFTISAPAVSIQNQPDNTNINLVNFYANDSIEITTEQSVAEIGKPVQWNKKIKVNGKGEINISLDLPRESQNVKILEQDKEVSHDRKRKGDFFSDFDEIEFSDKGLSENIYDLIYETPAPEKRERKLSNNRKEVIVSALDVYNYTNVLSYTYLENTIRLENKDSIKIYWKEEDKYLGFNVSDEDNDGFIDRIEWIVPHLSTQTFEIIIEITNAEHLDSNRNFISNIFDKVKALDNIWSEEIPSGDYVRVTFEKNLTNENDITIFPEIVSGNPTIEVYEKDGNNVLATFVNIISNSYNKIFLTSLVGEQDTFDLLILGGSVIFDYIVDPFGSDENSIIQIFQDNILQDADTEISVQFNNETIVGSNFSHPLSTNLQFNEDGWYKVSYGCQIEEVGAGAGSREEITGWLELDGVEVLPSRTYTYLRDSEVYANRGALSAVTLVNATSGSNITLQLDSTFGAEDADPEESCWIYAEKLHRPAVLIRETTDYDNEINDSIHFTQDFGEIVFENSTVFTADLTNNWITVDVSGWYKIYYVSGSEQTSGTSDNDRITPTTYLYKNNTVELMPSLTFSYHKRADQAAFSTEEGYTIAFLNSGENISMRRFASQQQQATAITQTLDDTWILMEKLPNDNILLIWDNSGGQGITSSSSTESAPANITWDSQTQVGSFYSHVANQANFTIDVDGWFEISYAVSFEAPTAANRKISCAQLIRNGVVLEPSRLCDYERDSGGVDRNSVAGNFIVNNTAGSVYTLQQTVIPQNNGGGHLLLANSSWISVIPIRDVAAPYVTIVSPQNITYNISSISFNISLDEIGDFAWYTLNGGGDVIMTQLNSTSFGHVNSSIPDGFYTVNFYANDSSGNLNNTEQISFTIDTTPPIITINSPESPGINYSTPSVLFNVTLNEDGNSCSYSIDGGAINNTMTSIDNRTYNATNSSVLDGQYIVNYYCNDTVGNLGTNSRNFGVDTTNPSAFLDLPDPINYTTDNLDLNFTVFDSNVGVDTCWYNQNDEANVTINNCLNTTFISQQGNVNLRFFVNDTVGNLNDTETVSYFVDSIAPIVQFVPPTFLNGSGDENPWIFVNVTVDETNFQNITYVLFNDTGLVNQTTYTSLITEINWTPLNNSFVNYTYNVTVYDILGNFNFTETRHLQLTPGDVNPPNIFFDNPPTENYYYNTSSVYFQVTLSENGSLVWFQINENGVNYTMQNLDNITWNYTNSSMPDGHYNITVYANDTVGNLGTRVRNFSVDTVYPLISYIPSTENSGANVSRDWIFVNVSATELNEDFINFTLYLDGILYNYSEFTDGTREVNWTSVQNGNYEYNVTIVDLATNINFTETRSIRLDNITPSQADLLTPINNSLVNNPLQNLTVNATDNLGLANLTLLVYNVTNNLINQTTINISGLQVETGILFNFPYDGNFSWSYNVVDTAGNTNLTNNFSIIVDATNPLIEFISPTPGNASELEQDFIFLNVSVIEPNFENITFNLYNDTGGSTLVNSTVFFELNENTTNINFTDLNSANITYFVNVTVYDFFNNTNSTETRTIILIDTRAPGLVLLEPEETVYESNLSIPITFTVSDLNLDTCWYNVDGGSNVTLTNCLNSNFDTSDFSNHTLTLYANDTLGQLNVTSVNFTVNSSFIETNTWFVQRGSVNVDGVLNVPLSRVDRSKSFIRHTQRSSDSGPDSLFVMNNFINSTTIRFENFVAGSGADVEWEVITGPDLVVQRGIQNFGTGTTIVNVTLGRNFNLSASFLVISTNLDSGSGADNQQGRWRARFYNQTMIQLVRGVSGNEGNVSWQAVEWQGANIQNGSFSVSATSGSDTISNPVNVNETFLIFSSTSDSGTALDFNNIGGFIEDLNTVSFYRQDDDAGFMYADWFVVETNILDVQRGDFTIGSSTPVDNPLSKQLINTSRTFHTSFWDSTGSGNTHANAILTTELTNSTNIQAVKGTGSQTQNVSWQSIEIIELDPPVVNLVYPSNNFNFSTFTISQFNYSVGDESVLVNCSLFGNWSGGWHLNQTVGSPSNDIDVVQNFSLKETDGDGFYIWNVECIDVYGNIGFNSTNYTFATFLFPESVVLLNISQTDNNGTGNITLYWNTSNHSLMYRVYSSSGNFSNFILVNETTLTNYTDSNFSGNIRKFYRIDSWNPSGQNASEDYFGAHVYELRHNGNTRNWISFPTNFSYLVMADDALNEITNATAFTLWNATVQGRVTCNGFSCPDTPLCTDSNCNFNFTNEEGRGYEANINSSAPSIINWSGVGIVYSPLNISLIKNSTSFGKNWISMYANTTLINAQSLLTDISNSDATSKWNSSLQTSQGYLFVPVFGIYVGTNFPIKIEEGYEVSVTQNTTWLQS